MQHVVTTAIWHRERRLDCCSDGLLELVLLAVGLVRVGRRYGLAEQLSHRGERRRGASDDRGLERLLQALSVGVVELVGSGFRQADLMEAGYTPEQLAAAAAVCALAAQHAPSARLLAPPRRRGVGGSLLLAWTWARPD